MNLAEKGIIIRRTLETDLRSIYLTLSENKGALSGGLSAERLADLFASDHPIFYSAVRKKVLLGFIIGNAERDKTFLEMIFVKEKFRRCGIGSLLLEKFLQRSEKINSSAFIIELPPENIQALNFFIKKGFIQSGNKITLRNKDI